MDYFKSIIVHMCKIFKTVYVCPLSFPTSNVVTKAITIQPWLNLKRVTLLLIYLTRYKYVTLWCVVNSLIGSSPNILCTGRKQLFWINLISIRVSKIVQWIPTKTWRHHPNLSTSSLIYRPFQILWMSDRDFKGNLKIKL